MPAVLYAVPGSGPCATVERALFLKGVAHRRVDLLPIVHAGQQLARFGRRTVPGLVLEGGEKVVGSREIVRRLDELVPEPLLVPDDEEVRRAEEWGEQVLQPLVRRLAWATLRRRPGAMASYAEGADLPVPIRVAALGSAAVAAAEVRLHGADEENVRADLMNLDFHLDRIDHWIADGVLGGPAVTGADLQIGASLRLLETFGDLAPYLADRPAQALARAQFPDFPGHVEAGVLPPDWLQRGPGATDRAPVHPR